jgi:hypothetical protein
VFGIIWNGLDIPIDSFDRNSLRDYIAYSIASTAAVHCRDNEAALELLRYEADKIIEQVKIGTPPR